MFEVLSSETENKVEPTRLCRVGAWSHPRGNYKLFYPFNWDSWLFPSIQDNVSSNQVTRRNLPRGFGRKYFQGHKPEVTSFLLSHFPNTQNRGQNYRILFQQNPRSVVSTRDFNFFPRKTSLPPLTLETILPFEPRVFPLPSAQTQKDKEESKKTVQVP